MTRLSVRVLDLFYCEKMIALINCIEYLLLLKICEICGYRLLAKKRSNLRIQPMECL